MRILATVLVSLLLPLSFASTAEATRPVPGYPYKDECNNFAGVQPAYMLVGTGPYRERLSTADPDDCRKWSGPARY